MLIVFLLPLLLVNKDYHSNFLFKYKLFFKQENTKNAFVKMSLCVSLANAESISLKFTPVMEKL